MTRHEQERRILDYRERQTEENTGSCDQQHVPDSPDPFRSKTKRETMARSDITRDEDRNSPQQNPPTNHVRSGNSDTITDRHSEGCPLNIDGLEPGRAPLVIDGPTLSGPDQLRALTVAAGIYPTGWCELRNDNDKIRRQKQQRQQSVSSYPSPPSTTSEMSPPDFEFYLKLPISPEWKYNDKFDEATFWEDFLDAWEESVAEESVERRWEFEYDVGNEGRRVWVDGDEPENGGG